MDIQKQQDLFEDKYEAKLGLSFEDWLKSAPNNEDEAYVRCQQIDEELKNTYDTWFNSQGLQRDELEDYRDRLKLEYDIIEEFFGLELKN